ncbi:type III pantothenate kinase [Seongchinamella sediminis]|uniref:type III pantothenate kinase n=1 Tax=Seongchinamella sediminis TaxID=2283635 RepID=UPI0013C2EC56|nr:type III pantothenate kinase [Seongchinamella sediminis]
MSLCLQLDVGNSSVKWRLLAGGELCDRGRFVRDDDAAKARLLEKIDVGASVWVSSVAGPQFEREFATLVEQRTGISPWFARSGHSAGGVANSYAEPARMGVDRWLAMLGARQHTRDRLCVVDAGSALTIDLVSAAGQHEGGYIIPGPALMERALLLDTDRVRFDEEVSYGLAPGTSTAEAVRHGIALAQVGAIATALAQGDGDAPVLFFCGGAGETLMQLLDRGGTHVPDLVFEGLAVLAAESARG